MRFFVEKNVVRSCLSQQAQPCECAQVRWLSFGMGSLKGRREEGLVCSAVTDAYAGARGLPRSALSLLMRREQFVETAGEVAGALGVAG